MKKLDFYSMIVGAPNTEARAELAYEEHICLTNRLNLIWILNAWLRQYRFMILPLYDHIVRTSNTIDWREISHLQVPHA